MSKVSEIFQLFLIATLTFLRWLFQAWVFSILWGWFVVSKFHLPPLGIVESLGLNLLYLSLCKAKNSIEKPRYSEKNYLRDSIADLFDPAFILLVGYAAHIFQ